MEGYHAAGRAIKGGCTKSVHFEGYESKFRRVNDYEA